MMMRIKDAEQAQSLAELNRKIAELEIQVISTACIGDALKPVMVYLYSVNIFSCNNTFFVISAKTVLHVLINVRYFNTHKKYVAVF